MFGYGKTRYAVVNGCSNGFIDYHYPRRSFIRVRNGTFTFIYRK